MEKWCRVEKWCRSNFAGSVEKWCRFEIRGENWGEGGGRGHNEYRLLLGCYRSFLISIDIRYVPFSTVFPFFVMSRFPPYVPFSPRFPPLPLGANEIAVSHSKPVPQPRHGPTGETRLRSQSLAEV